MWIIDLAGLVLALVGWFVLFAWTGKTSEATDGIVGAIEAIKKIKEAKG